MEFGAAMGCKSGQNPVFQWEGQPSGQCCQESSRGIHARGARGASVFCCAKTQMAETATASTIYVRDGETGRDGTIFVSYKKALKGLKSLPHPEGGG